MSEIKDQGEGYLSIENFIGGRELYIEADLRRNIPTYIETRWADNKKWFLCIDGDDLNMIVNKLAKISHYCYGVHENVEDIAYILKMGHEYDCAKAKEKEQDSKHD